jgi:adenosine deaminase
VPRTPFAIGARQRELAFEGFLDFIAQYVAMCGLLNAAEDSRRLAYEMTQDLSRNGVRYAEAVFSPPNHAARLRGDWISARPRGGAAVRRRRRGS